MNDAVNDGPTLARNDTEDGWFYLFAEGWTVARIAREAGEKRAKVKAGVEAARAREAARLLAAPSPPSHPPLSLRVIFGASCKAKPECGDIHPRGPMPVGSRDCCFHCHQTGVEGHPALQLDEGSAEAV